MFHVKYYYPMIFPHPEIYVIDLGVAISGWAEPLSLEAVRRSIGVTIYRFEVGKTCFKKREDAEKRLEKMVKARIRILENNVAILNDFLAREILKR
jgi:hypothetical protein